MEGNTYLNSVETPPGKTDWHEDMYRMAERLGKAISDINVGSVAFWGEDTTSVPVFVSNIQFKMATNRTSDYLVGRAIRIELEPGNYNTTYVTRSIYDSDTNTTIITVDDAILTEDLSKIFFGQPNANAPRIDIEGTKSIAPQSIVAAITGELPPGWLPQDADPIAQTFVVDHIIPHTSDWGVSGVAYVSSIFNESFSAWKCLDGLSSSAWASGVTGDVSGGIWWEYIFHSPRSLSAFSITSIDEVNRNTDIIDFDIYLDDVLISNYIVSSWMQNEKKTFVFTTSHTCKKIRIVINDITGTVGVDSASIALFEPVFDDVTTGNVRFLPYIQFATAFDGAVERSIPFITAEESVLITEPFFNSSAGWTVGTLWNINDGEAEGVRGTETSGQELVFSGLSVGKKWARLTISDHTSGSIKVESFTGISLKYFSRNFDKKGTFFIEFDSGTDVRITLNTNTTIKLTEFSLWDMSNQVEVSLTTSPDGTNWLYGEQTTDGNIISFGSKDIEPEVGISRNGVDSLPVFTDYTRDGWGTVTTSSERVGSEAWTALDKEPLLGGWLSASGVPSATWQIDFTASRKVIAYAITATNGRGHIDWFPRDWTVIDSAGNELAKETHQPSPGQGATRLYKITNPVDDSRFLLNITKNNGTRNGNSVGFALITLFFAEDFYNTAELRHYDKNDNEIRRVYLGTVYKSGGEITEINNYVLGNSVILPINNGNEVVLSTRYVLDSPFLDMQKDSTVRADVYVPPKWSQTGHQTNVINGSGLGTNGNMTQGDGVVVQTGNGGIMGESATTGGGHGLTPLSTVRCRVLVKRSY